jgi:hypothetical protein
MKSLHLFGPWKIASHKHGTEFLSKKQRHVKILILSIQFELFFLCMQFIPNAKA